MTGWETARDEYWRAFDLYHDANEPVVISERSVVTYTLAFTPERRRELNSEWKDPVTWNPFHVNVDVDEYGMATLGRHTRWFGKGIRNMSHQEKREIYLWLQEWEFIELRPIGPEDSEYFATDKLTGGNS
jgi:hypothetical protein